ncbi:Nucleotide-binding universal stress protein, UspA family [Belliella buryatensis]|uniref:Nucleotide-binding universal stress protein, UspA family n=1 Tax=Belliella buryatensis TaxID=1500549 RepID=A0A239ACJ0_9BACT|nr:universal stress protein [Belliella buryatensis]SNR93357.1 Nucleotide-binding universal stress protein, UspA family [Belliella buryatensis]
MKKILIPTDFSSCAKAAEKYGIALAKKIDAEVLFMHIIITPIVWAKLTPEQENLFPDKKSEINTAKANLKELMEKAQAMGVMANKLLVYSNGAERINKYVESEKVDLVVMGSHGTYGFKEHMLGSNTYSMLRRTNVPVIVIKEGFEHSSLDTLVIATNFREETGKSFAQIENFAELLQAELKVLYVNTPDHFVETNDILKIGQLFLDEFATYNHEINIIDAFREERGIIQFTKNTQADAVAVITFGKSDLLQYFSPSVTENLIAMIDIPVISLRKNSI